MKAAHDFEDLIELPEFINIASNQGNIPMNEDIESLNIEELPHGELAVPENLNDEKANFVPQKAEGLKV